MNYNQLFSLVRPYFVARTWNTLSTNDSIESYVNMTIQELYNFHDWVFKNRYEEVTTYEELPNGHRKFTLTYPIDRPISIYDQNDYVLNPTSGRIALSTYGALPQTTVDQIQSNIVDNTDCNVGTDFIVTHGEVDSIKIEYISAYVWIEQSKNGVDVLPFPTKFVPPIFNRIIDLASPLAIFEDDNTVPRYQVWLSQLKDLKQVDWVSADSYFMPDKSL